MMADLYLLTVYLGVECFGLGFASQAMQQNQNNFYFAFWHPSVSPLKSSVPRQSLKRRHC